jgi:gliding motility-associated lipoprotein GldH
VKEEGQKNYKIDTLNYILAKPNGEWLGEGFGETKEIMFLYKSKYTFPKSGKYTVGILQAMRANDLKGIEDVGVKIENATQP